MAEEINLLASNSGFGDTEDPVFPWQSDSDSTVFGKATPAQIAGAAAEVDWGDIGGTLSNQTDLQSALDAKASTSSIANMVTAAGTLTSGNLVSGGGSKAAQDASIAAANVVTAASNLTNAQLTVGDGSKGLSTLAAGTDTHVLTMVSGSPAWAAASSGSGDVVGPSSVTGNRVVLFDGTTGKLIKESSIMVETSSVITVGTNLAIFSQTARQVILAASAGDTVQIGNSTGTLAVAGSATFNGALLSPGTGTNSVKLGPVGANGGRGTDSVSIGSNVSMANGSLGDASVHIGHDLSSANGVSTVLIGNGITVNQGRTIVAIGSNFTGNINGPSSGSIATIGAVLIGNSITPPASTGVTSVVGIGLGVSVQHSGGVAIGADNSGNGAATAATNDYVLGVAAHNYKLPGTIITDLRFRTTTGTKIGTGTDQLLGFWNATPVDQPAAIADATDNPSAITQLNLLLASMREVGLIASA